MANSGEDKKVPGRRSSQKETGGATAGDEARFLKAFDEYADALFRHASFRLTDKERAIEIVHDTFTKVWGYLRDGKEIDSYKSFLYKVLGNLIIDEYRRRKEISLDSVLDSEGVDESSIAELRSGGLEELTFSLDAKRAADLITELPVVYREVITLRYVDGLGPKEISDLIEETENVVSVRLHRGLKILKDLVVAREEAAREKRNAFS